MYERKEKRTIVIFFAVIFTAISFLSLFACKKESELTEEILEEDFAFSVHFIDVGEGNSTVVKFSDGKVFLFDVGTESDKNYEKIKSVLEALSVTEIEYLVLSHADGEHIGNLSKILDDYSVKTVYMPKILIKEKYPEFSAVYRKLPEDRIKNPKCYDYEKGDGYFFAFLYPDLKGNAYANFNGNLNPTESERDDVSPIIYLDCAGVRFILTADATAAAEETVREAYGSGVLGTVFNSYGLTVDLNGVDFYLTASHGDVKSNSEKFLNLISPKRAVISVGGDNIKGHPSSSVLNRLSAANEEIEILRTDYFGTISAFIKEDGSVSVKKER